MKERQTEKREGKLKMPEKETVEVIIVDRGENLMEGEPSNHDKIEVEYKNTETSR